MLVIDVARVFAVPAKEKITMIVMMANGYVRVQVVIRTVTMPHHLIVMTDPVHINIAALVQENTFAHIPALRPNLPAILTQINIAT